jgi:hypothetical protein
MTRLQPFTDPQLFFTAALPFWRSRPAESSLQWSLSAKWAKQGEVAQAFILYQGDEVHAVGLQTDSPRPLILQAAGPLGERDVHLIEAYCGELPGLVAIKTLTDDYLFSTRYAPLGTVVLVSYQLDELIPGFSRPNGELVSASSVPIELITEWLEKFILFIEETGNDGNYLEQARNLVSSGNLYVYLLDGVPVSMAASTRSQGGVAAVNYVFTPEQLRKNGYAYSCVGELSTHLLQTHDCCILYADKDYPASNRVYQKLGYYDTGESLEVLF